METTLSTSCSLVVLEERIEKAEQALQHLLVRKQGKPHLKTRTEIDKAIQAVMKKFRVEDFNEEEIRAFTFGIQNKMDSLKKQTQQFLRQSMYIT